MRLLLPACFGVTLLILATLAHAVATDVKPVEILYLPRILFAGRDLGFMVRVHAIDTDRAEWAILCDASDVEPCTTEHHDRASMVSIEGSAAPKLWSPKPWTHMQPGDYTVVAAIGPVGSIRAHAALTVMVQGF